MKALLALLLIVSIAANVLLLSGCTTSVSGTVVTAPPEFSRDELEGIKKAIPEKYMDHFDKINSYVEKQRGKTIVDLNTNKLDNLDKVILYIEK